MSTFAAGRISTPADAAGIIQPGCDGVFVRSGIFKSGNAAKRAKAIVIATRDYGTLRLWQGLVKA